MKIAILNGKMLEGRLCTPYGEFLPTSNAQQSDVERCPSIAVSI
jgi:hypothetical protein